MALRVSLSKVSAHTAAARRKIVRFLLLDLLAWMLSASGCRDGLLACVRFAVVSQFAAPNDTSII